MIVAKVVGLVALNAQLAHASRAIRSATQGQLEKSTDRLVEAIRGAAPVDDGELRDSVRREKAEREPGVVMRVGGTDSTMRASQSGGPVHDVALSTEFGTETRRAHPFVYSTVDAFEAQIIKEAGEAAMKAAEDS